MSGFFEFGSERELVSEEEGCMPAFSMKERIAGFLVCFGLSIVIDILSWGSLIGLVTGSPTRFALSYTLGNILAIVGTGFLVGFSRELKSIFDKKRWIASSVFVVSMILTLISAIVLQIAVLTLVCIIVQVCAFIWYVASYVPWGRSCLSGCLKKTCGKCFEI